VVSGSQSQFCRRAGGHSYHSAVLKSGRSGGPRIVAILGMHRSGTSWMSGSLELAGLELGVVNTWASHNQRGNRENTTLRVLHDAVLQDNLGSWDAPPAAIVWHRKRSIAARRFIRAMDAAHRDGWGFKDPRTLLVLDWWLAEIGSRVERVGIVRHPMAVAGSLHRRNADFSLEAGVELWARYNRCLLEEHRRAPFPIIEFGDDVAANRRAVHDVADHLGLSAPDRSAEFLDAELVHRDAPQEVPEAVGPLWDSLRSIAASQWSDRQLP
jgi:hypothetical protein